MAGELVSRIYSNFRGVDFRGEEINLVRSPDSLNVWKDYKETESIRTRPGLKAFDNPLYGNFAGHIHGIYFFNDLMFVHDEKRLIVCDANGNATPCRQLINDAPSCGFVFENVFYFIDGNYFWKYEQSGVDADGLVRVEGYIPTTSIARKPAGGGTVHEDVNLIQNTRRNTFLGDGESTEFYLDATDISTVTSIKVNGDEAVSDSFTVNRSEGRITFKTAPPAPLTDGQDNVSVEFIKDVSGYRERIVSCTIFQVFDNRIFASGNPDYPNTVWHCSLNDPTYWSDLDSYREGIDDAKITGLVAGNNALWVFREPSDANTTVFYHTPTIDADYGKIYPSTHSSIATGCVGKAINFNDDIVFFSDRGMEGISGDVTTEQMLGHRSTLVDRKLTVEPEYKNMILAEWEGYLLVFIGDKAYLADSRSAFTNENHIEYEWFYWDFKEEIQDIIFTCACVKEGVLYLGTNAGVYTLTDTTKNIRSWWTTPKDKFMYPHKLKTTNKRGCVVEATGDLSVYAKLEDTDFELMGEYKNIEDYFVCRIKRKKFKDIQLSFYSKTRFSLETASLECFVGGYIKR